MARKKKDNKNSPDAAYTGPMRRTRAAMRPLWPTSEVMYMMIHFAPAAGTLRPGNPADEKQLAAIQLSVDATLEAIGAAPLGVCAAIAAAAVLDLSECAAGTLPHVLLDTFAKVATAVVEHYTQEPAEKPAEKPAEEPTTDWPIPAALRHRFLPPPSKN